MDYKDLLLEQSRNILNAIDIGVEQDKLTVKAKNLWALLLPEWKEEIKLNKL